MSAEQDEAAACPSTITDRSHPCILPRGHDGQHKGAGWVWWHGNGEACEIADCWMCEAVDRQDNTTPTPAAEVGRREESGR